MNEGPRYVSFRDYLRVARERRLLIIVVTLLFVGSALVYALTATPRYTAEALVEFDSPNQQSSLFGVGQDIGGQTPEQRAATYAEIINRPAVLDRARKILKRKIAANALATHVAAQPETRTQLVVVRAHATTGKAAADLANAVARAAVYVTRDDTRKRFKQAAAAQRRVLKKLPPSRGPNVQRLQTAQAIARLDELSRVARPAFVQRDAGVPHSPTSPKRVTVTLIGLLIGLTLGLVAAFARDSLDRRFKSMREITDELHLPLLGFVHEELLGRPAVGSRRRKAFSDIDLEGFRILRTNIEFLNVDEPPKVVVVTSALPEEGKSTVAAALALTYAAAGKRTLMAECDLRRPALARRLGVDAQPGLSDYLVGNATPAEVLHTIALPTQSVDGSGPAPEDGVEPVPLVAIVAGSPTPQPTELLRSKRCQSFFEQARQVYDVMIVDCCPLLSVADTLEVLPLSDAVVLCVRASKTTRDQARAAKAALSHLPERPTGVVITGARSAEEGASYGYYSYGEVYGASTR